MIDPAYCLMMAQYNAHQNNGLRRVVEAMPMAELTKERGAFFGSVFATLNHLLWADQLWLSRLAGTKAPGPHNLAYMPTIAAWGAERFRTDGQITEWARKLRAVELAGNLTWRAVIDQKDYTEPKAMCVVHFFNHQTHHRGQVHAMLTAAGQTLPATDLTAMPGRA